jgi:hypothetical protein
MTPIVDADCHISSHKFDGLAITADELIAQMDRNGVERALVWLKPPYDKNIEPENRAIFAATQRYPDRLLGFGWVNPRLGRDAARAAVDRCLGEYGLLGIKFNGAQDGYVIDDPKLVLPHIEHAASYGKVLAFHIGADFYENTHPYRLGHIAARFPEARFLLIHIGGAGLPALDRAAIETAQAHPNITLIGSNVNEHAIARAIDVLGADRVCFGSDAPFRMQHVQMAMYDALLRDHPEADRAKVMGANILRVVHGPA